MFKDIDEELFDKYSNLVLYSTKIKSLKILTKGHKQRFINMVLEVLKFKSKNIDAQIWIYYTLAYFQKDINKYKKAVDEPVARKLEQQIKEIISISPYKMEFKEENKNNENIIKCENDNKSKKEINEKKSEASNNKNIINDDLENKIIKKINQMFEKINKFASLKDFISNSITKENRSNPIFCEIYQILNNINLPSYPHSENIITRQKLLNFICLIFPFISAKQKIQILQKMEIQFESDAIKILENSKFIDKSKKNNIFELLIFSIISKEVSNDLFSPIFKKKLFFQNSEDLFELYKVYLIIAIFGFKGNKDYIYKICFKIRFILENYKELYEDSVKIGFKEVLNILSGIKIFYKNGYNNKFWNELNEQNNKLDLEVNPENTFENPNSLFETEDNLIYEEFYKNINKLYIIKNNIDLVSGYIKELKQFDFPFDLIELIQMKKDLIENNFLAYKTNLINIEKTIYRIGYESFFPNDNDILAPMPKIISKYTINENLKNIFDSLDYFLKKKLFKYNFKLYPYGSSTEFLSDKDSDIDLYLDISNIETKEQKLQFLYDLIHFIKYFDKSVNSTISTRVCVITFVYKNINFDMSIVGYCPYLHSVLIREYSLIDPRFPLLMIAIKHLIKILKINNIAEDKNHSFLNSFSWSLLLIGFLQDIIQPPILPKLLSKSEIMTTQTFYGNNKLDKEEEDNKNFMDKNTFINNNIYNNNMYNNNYNNNDFKYEKLSKNKTFESYINNMELNDINVPIDLSDKNFRLINYNNQIKNKNNMTCAELLLKFLEFIIYYFKYDTLFMNCSDTYEGFQNINEIYNTKSIEDSKFLNYFRTKYIKKNKEEKTRDGYFLLRDPFDSRYNPGQTMKNSSLKKFFSRLKLAYYHLIKYGNLDQLKKQIESEEELSFKKGKKN